MASLLSPRRTDPDIALHATVPIERLAGTATQDTDPHVLNWTVIALLGGPAVALSGWILVTGLVVVGWLSAVPGSFVGALHVGTQLWLLANGAGGRLGSTPLTLIPWGATAIFAFMLRKMAAFAARQVRNEPSARTAGLIAAVMTVTYLAPVALTALLSGAPVQSLQGLIPVVVIVGTITAWASWRTVGYDPISTWPAWSRVIPRAVIGAQLAMLVAGAGALTVAMVNQLARMVHLTNALHPGVAGGIALVLAQLAFVPNAVIWAASYTLGPGFTLGHGTVVSLTTTQLGMLPAVPLFGALPSPGPGATTSLWWLVGGVLAGGVAARLGMRARPAARCDETSLVGGLSGMLAGLVFVGLAWASSGDLGGARLAGAGPRLLPLLVMSVTLMSLSGMVVGLLLGLLRRSPR